MKTELQKYGKWLYPLALFSWIIWGTDWIFDLNFVQNMSDTSYYLLLFVILILKLIFVILAISFFQQGQMFFIKKAKWRDFGLVIGFFALNFLWAVLFSLVFKTTNNQAALQETQHSLSGVWQYFIWLSYVCFFAPVTEEFVFRGAFMSTYFENHPYYFDVILSSIAFSALHIIGHSWLWFDFLYYFIVGVMIASMRRITGSIYLGILLHVLWNSFATLMFF